MNETESAPETTTQETTTEPINTAISDSTAAELPTDATEPTDVGNESTSNDQDPMPESFSQSYRDSLIAQGVLPQYAELIASGEAVSLIAQLCHEANRALCEAFGDQAQVAWENAEPWQQHSAYQGVVTHLRSNLSITPKASHAAWMTDKKEAGWKWGARKDADAKTHPCMVPFHELPREQQAKDHVFTSIVHTVAKIFTKE